MEKTIIQAPADVELEDKLLSFLEKAQEKKQSIQSLIDFIQDGLFSTSEHQKRYEAILEKHKQQRPASINAQQGYWLGDLANLQKKRELLEVLQDFKHTLTADKLSFKIVKKRLLTEIEAIA